MSSSGAQSIQQDKETNARVRRVRRGSLSVQKAPPNIAYARHISSSSARHDSERAAQQSASSVLNEGNEPITARSEHRMLARRYPRAEWVWIKDPEKGFVLGRKDNSATKASEGKYCYILQATNESVVLTEEEIQTKVYTISDVSELDKTFTDMVQMVEVNAPMILHNVEKRFRDDLIYTNIGMSQRLIYSS